jgi:hypothetical protein
VLEAPECLQAMGNWGNALLAHGKLRLESAERQLAEESIGGMTAGAEQALTEAEEQLVQAGRRFREVIF